MSLINVLRDIPDWGQTGGIKIPVGTWMLRELHGASGTLDDLIVQARKLHSLPSYPHLWGVESWRDKNLEALGRCNAIPLVLIGGIFQDAMTAAEAERRKMFECDGVAARMRGGDPRLYDPTAYFDALARSLEPATKAIGDCLCWVHLDCEAWHTQKVFVPSGLEAPIRVLLSKLVAVVRAALPMAVIELNDCGGYRPLADDWCPSCGSAGARPESLGLNLCHQTLFQPADLSLCQSLLRDAAAWNGQRLPISVNVSVGQSARLDLSCESLALYGVSAAADGWIEPPLPITHALGWCLGGHKASWPEIDRILIETGLHPSDDPAEQARKDVHARAFFRGLCGRRA